METTWAEDAARIARSEDRATDRIARHMCNTLRDWLTLHELAELGVQIYDKGNGHPRPEIRHNVAAAWVIAKRASFDLKRI